MASQSLTCIDEFPLTPKTAKAVIKDLAYNYNRRVLFSKHARTRMKERKVTTEQIFNVLRSNSSRFEELPHQTPEGDWKMNLEGFAAGDKIRVVLVLKRLESDPSAFVVTVVLP